MTEKELLAKIELFESEKAKAVANQDYEKASEIRDQIDYLNKVLEEHKKQTSAN
ncbi:MAG: UvrB/UvrC motif-containing protein [Crocinitomicaceae bacterium]|nr:UvrB/UvrC motif-containing protein [Crocinitomicaceae bacterium]